MNALSYISSNLVVPLEKLNRNCNDKIQDDERDENDGTTRLKSVKVVQDENSRFFVYFWMVVLFLPRYLVLRPIQFIWWLICSPLLLVEYGVKSRLKKAEKKRESVEENGPVLRAISENDEDDLAGGDEIILQRDAVKGSLSKASGSSGRRQSVTGRNRSSARSECSSNVVFGTKRMGRFLFPKKLIPKSVLHAERRKRLVVDLDETLIHSASRSTSHSNSSQGHMVEVRFAISGVSTLYYVHKRPHCDLFLSKVSKWYDLVVFTASMKEYADPVIDWLESSFSGRFAKRLYRNNCILRDGVGYIKDLSIVCGPLENSSNVGLGEVILVDNSPVSYAMNVENAIQVEGWISDPSDNDLLTLLPFLEALRHTTDVRDILALKNGEQAFLQ
ncbi:hypothetical protein HG537_0A04570 [Torulaspora globosa]|uniref:FCP1 homology domain-containing protein n=1 Tax=Torulaspora globosa TaxID=48254 RepID=A0A7H9HLK3_9SACH|nr:hypothetical protein HG537_0A04570 [Torulaspora sp. CBS 2947]